MILVTGATGFVGQALCAELQHRGMEYRPVSRQPRDGFHASGTMDEATDWTSALIGLDAVVHLAARVHVMKDSVADPLAAFRAANVATTLNLAKQAAASGVKRFVFISSIKVNGEATAPGRPFTAGDVPHPGDPYGVSKHEAEQALFALGSETGMEIVIIRPPLVYGPGVKANFASMMRLVKKAYIPLPFGGIANRRSLVFVGNLVDFILLGTDHPAAAGKIFLVSDGTDLSLGELLRKLGKKMGRKIWVPDVPARLIEASLTAVAGRAVVQRLFGSLQVDITDTRALTGWTPPYTVDEGLRRTAEAFLKSA
jgi:UDP-glucose 4-epimerase